jgi:hypothetical protein
MPARASRRDIPAARRSHSQSHQLDLCLRYRQPPWPRRPARANTRQPGHRHRRRHAESCRFRSRPGQSRPPRRRNRCGRRDHRPPTQPLYSDHRLTGQISAHGQFERTDHQWSSRSCPYRLASTLCRLRLVRFSCPVWSGNRRRFSHSVVAYRAALPHLCTNVTTSRFPPARDDPVSFRVVPVTRFTENPLNGPGESGSPGGKTGPNG